MVINTSVFYINQDKITKSGLVKNKLVFVRMTKTTTKNLELVINKTKKLRQKLAALNIKTKDYNYN